MPFLTVKIRVKTDGVRKGGAGGTVTRLCDATVSTYYGDRRFLLIFR